MISTNKIYNLLLTGILLSGIFGCSANSAVVAKDADNPKLARAVEEPRIEPVGKIVNAIAAVVNDETVSLFEVQREAQPFIREAEKKAPLDSAALTQIRRAALDRMVEKRLVEQKIRELNIKVSEEEIRQAIDDIKRQNNIPSQDALVAALASQGLSFDQYRTQLQEQIEKLKLVSMEVRSKVQVGETEMREYYDANRSKYTEDEAFHARHIFFKISEKAQSDEIKRAMTTALAVLADARSGKDFAELAKTYSEDPAARKDGGDLGTFKKNDMLPELVQAILPMKAGEVSELVYTPAGFHIIKLEERISGKLRPFEGLKAEIEEAIYRKKSEDRFSQWAKELRSKASVDIRPLKGML